MRILDLIKADKHNEEADKINIKALNRLSNAERELRIQEQKTLRSMEKLANRKRGILSTTINDFLATYEKIMRINFVESDGIKELNCSKFNNEDIAGLRSIVVTAGHSMNSNQLIATFTIGVLKTGIGGGVTNVIVKEAELNAVAAKMRKKQAAVATSQAETIVVTLDAIFQRSERLAALLAQLNILFRRSLQNTEEIIERNGAERLNYSVEDKDSIRNCLNFADAVKKIIDTPLLDEEGELSIKSQEVIQMGEEYLNQISEAIRV